MARTLRLFSFAALLCLALPAAAGAQARVLGSPLTAEPNNPNGCETKPQLNLSGAYDGVPSGTPDCTWYQVAVFNVPSDPRTGGAPGNGTITSVSVRSGPNPSPLRFVIARIQAQPGVGTACCFFVSETANPVPLKPNAVTTFGVNIPVHNDVEDGVRAQDYIGVSGISGAGTLPLHLDGKNNSFQAYETGSVNAAFLYPRLGALPNDEGGGRSETAFPGMEVLLSWTFCPAGQNCAGGGGGTDRVAPVLQRPAFGPSTFRVSPRNTPISAAAPLGTTLKFKLSENSDVSIAIQRPAAGRLSKGKCVKPTKRLARAKRCTRWTTVATLKRKAIPAGSVSVPFTGRIRNRALTPGRYRAQITALDAAKNRSKAGLASFRIVK